MADDLVPILVLPGIYTEASGRASLNRYKGGLNIRFFKQFPEKIGGWAKLITTAFRGICRALLSWTDLTGVPWVALGTDKALYLNDGVSYFNITPIAASGTLGADPFATVNGSNIITVTHVAHSLNPTQTILFSGATSVGGLDPNTVGDSPWAVDTVVDADHYTFVHTGIANTTTTGGGASVAYIYEIENGATSSVGGGGWGVGAFGDGSWGTPRTGVGFIQARTWSLDNWGEDLIAAPYRDAIYTWVASSGSSTRAVLIPQAPAQVLFAYVSEKDRHMIAFGCFDPTLGVLDPMLINWCDAEDYTMWVAAEDNSAGDKRLDRGNGIVCVVKSRGQFVILTDRTIYTMTFSGSAFVFDFITEGETIGAIGPNCGFDIDGIVYYMGRGQFVQFTGQIEDFPCDVQSFVFTVDAERGFPGINMAQSAKVYCARNKIKKELIWFYCSAVSDEIDRCVGYCYEDGNESWWLGSMACTAFLDENVFIDFPIAPHADGYLFVHETGVDADGEGLEYSLESYDLESLHGTQTMLIKRLSPDYRRIKGTRHTCTVEGRKEPNGRLMTRETRFGEQSRWIPARMRARQIAIKIGSNGVGDDISFGLWRYEPQIMGLK